jgi:hypothetical protein
MKRLVCLYALIFCATTCLRAKDDPAAQKLLDTALEESRTFGIASAPYALESDVTIGEKKPLHGHFSIKWRDEDHW